MIDNRLVVIICKTCGEESIVRATRGFSFIEVAAKCESCGDDRIGRFSLLVEDDVELEVKK